ncbi:tetratricopeptide repeat protein 7B [Phlebotomus argentipes]|uniref:tetratricopeptide repeat protein 7B n=1 Tax=Phlebotomus argentipes TaxID=94469 RepID=UPI0028936BA5|nr:tetratricopeptide repeat protein 7B [Phlebotomus argentipes]
MTSRNRGSGKTETAIENCRSDGKWKKVIELAEELKLGSPRYESLSNFLIGEGKLENFLDETPPIEANFAKAKTGLSDAKNYLQMVTGEDGQRAGIALDAHLLLAKLAYACGQYDEVLEHFVKAELNSLSEKELTPRSLRILAESYAIKGLSLENQGPQKGTSRYKLAERESEMITSFERAADLGLLYLQDQDIVANTTASEPRRMGAILETALQRAPIVLIKAGKLQEAIDRYRSMLSAVEAKTTQSLRLTLARQLAEVLLRGVSGTIYTPPSTSTLPRSNASSKKLWKPRKYSSRNQFMPRNQHEETILLLLISEALAVRDALLSVSPEFREARAHTIGNATAVYDLLALATVRWGLTSLLHQSFEKALKFTFGEQHVWRQYALSLAGTGNYNQAVRALSESSLLVPTDPLPCLMSARLCYEHLGRMQEGIEHAQKALSKEVKGLRPSRAQLLVGIGWQQIALGFTLRSERDKYHRQALEAFEKAVQADSNDHLAEYYLALQFALIHDIPSAVLHIQTALALRAEHANSLQLFALLLTANRRHKEALVVVEDALLEFPDNLNLYQLKAHLELHVNEAERALTTTQAMLMKWKELYESQLTGETPADGMEKHSDTRSTQHHSSQLSDRDSSSVHAASISASRIEQALSEAASSLSSFSPRQGPQKALVLQIRIWLLMSDVYLALDQATEAMNCVQEAATINLLSPQVMYQRGRVHLHQNQLAEAKQNFLDAVSVNPYYTDALRALGETYHLLGQPRLAEKVLRDAVQIDPNHAHLWFTLGQVLETLSDFEAAADSMASALQLETHCPVLPFTSVALTFE